MPPDLLLFLVAVATATVVAFLSRRRDSPGPPNWAVGLYLGLFRLTLLPPLQRYARARTVTSGREQFLAAWFLTFFLIFLVGIFLLSSCGRRAC
jgi:hypothetical protein